MKGEKVLYTTAEEVAAALHRGCWLECQLEEWRVGLGIRSLGRGSRVSHRVARAAIKRDDVVRWDTGAGVIYVSANNPNANRDDSA